MKHLLYILLFIASPSFCQDVITKLTGEDIEAKVLEIGLDVIKYKKSSNLEGPSYSIAKQDVFRIKYKNGEIEIFTQLKESEKKEEKKVGIILEPLIDERDGNSYKLVQIKGQVWMAENLRYDSPESSCVDNLGDCSSCGKYYNFEEATKSCPSGFHLPSDDEWKQLEINLGMKVLEAQKYGWRGTSPGQGPKMMKGGESGLDFTICGYIHTRTISIAGPKPTVKRATEDKDLTLFWTATAKNKNHSYIRWLESRLSVRRVTFENSYKLSVRCLQD